jgi:hypothetical protein
VRLKNLPEVHVHRASLGSQRAVRRKVLDLVRGTSVRHGGDWETDLRFRLWIRIELQIQLQLRISTASW